MSEVKKEKIHNIYWRMAAFSVSIAYLEFVFHIAVYGRVDSYIIHPLLFAAAAGMLLAMLTVIFRPVGNAIAGYTLLGIISAYYVTQLIYFRIFGTFLSLVSVGGAENAMNFKMVMFEKLRQNIGWILCLFVPLAVLIIINRFAVAFKRPEWRQNIIGGCMTVITAVFAVLMLNVHGRTVYSPYNLFHEKYVMELSMNKLGVLVTTVRDGMELVSGEDDSLSFTFNDASAGSSGFSDGHQSPQDDAAGDGLASSSDAVNSAETANYNETTNYNEQIDESIDFKSLYDLTDDETLKNLTAYFSNQEPTMENEYTGMFQDYNVVFVTAESLSKYGISDACTPTLNKIMNDGFVFDNYYNPRWYHSTIDGEYVNCLGQYPCSSEWSFYKSADTYQPYALGNALNELGYASLAYHDFTFYYYNRSETHANMGYDFKAIDYGLEIPYNTPYSDYDTMEAVYEEFINEDKFNIYFMSFSGHLPYNYDYNAMSLKNREEAERLTDGMDLSDEEVAYIASQMELDKALEFLMDKLEEADKLDRTLFIVTPDHYPYGLSADTYNKMAGADISDDTFELHRSCLGIWSASMEASVCVDKYCSSVDVLPTVLNLLGVNYDSRLLAGDDILSDSEELVIFADHSFITDKIKYNTATGEITFLSDEHKVTDEYIKEMIEKVENRLSISDTMIDADYFRFVYGR